MSHMSVGSSSAGRLSRADLAHMCAGAGFAAGMNDSAGHAAGVLMDVNAPLVDEGSDYEADMVLEPGEHAPATPRQGQAMGVAR